MAWSIARALRGGDRGDGGSFATASSSSELASSRWHGVTGASAEDGLTNKVQVVHVCGKFHAEGGLGIHPYLDHYTDEEAANQGDTTNKKGQGSSDGDGLGRKRGRTISVILLPMGRGDDEPMADGGAVDGGARTCHLMTKDQFAEDEDRGNFGDYVVLTNNEVFQEQWRDKKQRENQSKAAAKAAQVPVVNVEQVEQMEQKQAEQVKEQMEAVKRRAVEIITFATGTSAEDAAAQVDSAMTSTAAGSSPSLLPPVLQALVAKQQELQDRHSE
jgi:hypothetical protein